MDEKKLREYFVIYYIIICLNYYWIIGDMYIEDSQETKRENAGLRSIKGL